MEAILLNTVEPYVGLISGLAAAAGLIFMALTFLKDDRTRQIQTASDIINDILDLQERLTEILVAKDSMSKEQFNLRRGTWVDVFCNKLEWFSFLLLKKRIGDEDVANYFAQPFKQMVEGIFHNEELVPKERRDSYNKINELYEKLNREKFL